jgi:succinoglycan biosynthesis protein ExoA
MSALPFVSVIVPVRNEEAYIRRALDAILTQHYPADRMEVLVVDGQSEDRTGPIVLALAESDLRLRLLDNPGRIQSQAMNIGLDAARGEVIVRVDGHTVIAPDYVSRCVHHLRRTGAQHVGGTQHFIGVTPLGRAIAAAYRSPFSVPSRFTISDKPEYVDTVYLGAWPREVFDQVGRFDETLAINEDYEHSYRIRQSGGRVFLSPDIRSDYYGRQTFSELGRQFFCYGQGKVRVLIKASGSARPRHFAAPALVATLVLGAILAPVHRWAARLWGGVLLSYAFANGAASILAAAGKDWGVRLRLPVVFALMHLAWGSGFWYEIVRIIWKARQAAPLQK